MDAARRGLLAWGVLSAIGLGTRSALGAALFGLGRQSNKEQTLVSIFLRGGADGLSIAPPYGDHYYARSRPTLALASPRSLAAGKGDRAIDLDGFFGLHPALSPLVPLYESGQLAIIPACGSGDQTRSHFEAMATMERGAYRDTGPASGWLARHLQSAPWENSSPLRAVALGAILPATLRGAPTATTVESVADLTLQEPWNIGVESVVQALDGMYCGKDALDQAGREAISVLKKMQSLNAKRRPPENGALYPGDSLGQGLRQTACLIKSGVGLEAACLDHTGYDTHIAQGCGSGALANSLRSLGGSLAAFAADLGPHRWARTTVVVLSEFGRRVEENSGAGTDHGRGGVMMVLGGQGIAGGKVHGEWPGLAPAQREGPGDVRMTTDYRHVLAEVIAQRLGNPHLDAVFPGMAMKPVGVVNG